MSGPLLVPQGIGCSWCFLPGWFGPGNKRCSSFRKTTLLRWHHQGFKLYWKDKSRAASAKPRISPETVALIKEMASNNRLWELNGSAANYSS